MKTQFAEAARGRPAGKARKLLVACSVVALVWMSAASQGRAECVQNCILDIIWEVRLTGTVGVQSFDQNVQPVMATRKLTETTFLTSALGRAPAEDEVLALQFRLETDNATVSLLVFNRKSRSVVQTIASGQPVNLFLDGRLGAFAASIPLPFSTTLHGGVLNVAGQVTQARNVPARIKAAVGGTISAPASSQPPFGATLHGLVMRAKMRSVREPLRVEPPVIPQPLFFP